MADIPGIASSPSFVGMAASSAMSLPTGPVLGSLVLPGADQEEQPLTLADLGRAPTAFGGMARRRAAPGVSCPTLRTTLLAASSVLVPTLGITEHFIGAATST